MREAAQAFWHERKEVAVAWDFAVWVSQLLHKVHLDMDLSQAEAEEFMTMQKKLLLSIGIPQGMAENGAVRAILKSDRLMDEKLVWIDRYKQVSRTILWARPDLGGAPSQAWP